MIPNISVWWFEHRTGNLEVLKEMSLEMLKEMSRTFSWWHLAIHLCIVTRFRPDLHLSVCASGDVSRRGLLMPPLVWFPDRGDHGDSVSSNVQVLQAAAHCHSPGRTFKP